MPNAAGPDPAGGLSPAGGLIPAVGPIPAWLASAPGSTRAWVPRPLGVLEVMDRGFAVLRSEFGVLGPVVAAVILPVAVLSVVAHRQLFAGSGGTSVFGLDSANALGGSGPWVVVPIAVTVLWPALVAGPACRVAAGSWFGRVVDRRTAARALVHMPAYGLAILLADVAVAVGFAIVFLPALVFWAMLHVTIPVMVLDQRNPFAALAGSVRLSSRRLGPAIGLALLTALLGEGLAVVLALLPDLFVSRLGDRAGFVVLAAGFLGVRVVTWTWAMITLTLFTLDLRARTEGLDLLVRAVGEAPAPARR